MTHWDERPKSLTTDNKDYLLGWATMILATDYKDDSLEKNSLQYWPADYD